MKSDLISKLDFSHEEKADTSDIELIDFLFKNIDDKTTSKLSYTFKFSLIASFVHILFSNSVVQSILNKNIENPYIKLFTEFAIVFIVMFVVENYVMSLKCITT